MSDPGSQGRYADVRTKLLERGYLDGRIERFVLRVPRSTGTAWLAPLLSAARAGVIAGPLLGAFLALLTAYRYPAAARFPDLAVLWLYLSVLSVVVLVVLNLLAAVILSTLFRRRGPRTGDRLAAAALATLPLLVYLGWIWWRGGGGTLRAADLALLAGTIGVALLAAWLAGVVSLAGIVSASGDVPARGKRPLLVLALVVSIPALALAAARVAMPVAGAGAEPSAFDLDPDRPRLLFVGVDGLDTDLVQIFAARGALSHLLDRMREGTTFPLHRGEGPEPAEVWTSLLTGMPPDEHGVTSAGADLLPGIATPLARNGGPLPLEAALRALLPTTTVPTRVSARPTPTLWEIVSLKIPASAVGWWATWPAGPFYADADRLYVVSDRVLPKLVSGAPRDRDTWPPSLFERLSSDFDEDRDRLHDAFLRAFPSVEAELIRHWLWESFLIDGYAWTASRRIADDDEVRASFVYLPGLDILRHRLERGDPGRDLATLLEMHEALELYVEWLDSLLGGVMDPGPGWEVLLVADPGRQASAQTEGFVVVVGEDAERACVGPVLTDADVAPLALALLRFPQSDEMPGHPASACIDEEASGGDPVATYGRRPASRAPETSPYDPEMVERLKSLGYLQ